MTQMAWSTAAASVHTTPMTMSGAMDCRASPREASSRFTRMTAMATNRATTIPRPIRRNRMSCRAGAAMPSYPIGR